MRQYVVRPLTATAVALLVVASPYIGFGRWHPSLVVLVFLFAIAGVGVNMMFGYAGMLSLGNAVFLGTSAYTMGLLHELAGIPVLFAAAIGIAVTALFSWLVGSIFVRIPGVYFAVGTLGLAVAFEGLIRAFPGVTGGASGLTIPRRLEFGPVIVDSVDGWYVLTALLAVTVGAIAYYMSSGRTGRVLRLIRHDQLAASVYGIDVPQAKLVVFVTSAVVTGSAGVVLFLWQGVVVPESVGLLQSVELVAITVVGGAGSWVGPFLGAGVIEYLNDIGRTLGRYREIFFGIVFLTVVLVARSGIVGIIHGIAAWVRGLDTRAGTAGHDVHVDPRQLRMSVRSTGKSGDEHRVPMECWTGDRSIDRGLTVQMVTKYFGGIRAVDAASLRAPSGAVTGLIGSNGAGKSTLMNVVSGVEECDAGSVMLDGADVTTSSPADRAVRGVARTFQVPRLVPNMTVLANVCLGEDGTRERVFRRRPSEEREAIGSARAALDEAGLGHLADRRADFLGSGERKFVELVRAVAWEPSVLLMDEPAVGLIDDEIDLLRTWVLDLRAAGTAVVLVDHNMDFIGDVADYVYLMKGGRVVAEGEPQEVVEILRGNPSAATGEAWSK